MSAVTQDDSGGITMTTSARSCDGESESSIWLWVLPKGAGLVAPPIRKCFCTIVFFRSGELSYIWAVYTQSESFRVLQVIGSLLHVVLAGPLTVLSDCLTWLCLRMTRSCAATLLSLDCVVYIFYLTVSQYCLVIVMATGNSQPGADRKGIDFKVHVQIRWNAPEACVMLNSPGVFELDIEFLPDVLGLRTWHPDAAPVWVLLGRK